MQTNEVEEASKRMTQPTGLLYSIVCVISRREKKKHFLPLPSVIIDLTYVLIIVHFGSCISCVLAEQLTSQKCSL